MTQFASIPPKLNAAVDEFDDGADTPTRIDREVSKLRASRPPGVEELRSKPRLSMSELNDLDWDQVRERMAKTTFDNRGPVTRFLDIIDLPRNTIANVVARGLAPKVRQRMADEGETATFGQPRVYTSEILKELGVRPGLIAGTLGFIGDVALDPLTYAGPPGWGAKLATKGGQVVRLGAQGRRAAQAAVKAVGRGGEVADPILRGLYHETVIPKLVSEATPSQRAEALSKSIFGDAATGLKDRIRRGDIFELRGSGGDIAESTLRPRNVEGADYAKDFLARYGEGTPLTLAEAEGKVPTGLRVTPKGVAFGNGQSAIAHIPFTEIGIYGPGFTQAGRSRMAQRVGALALSGSSDAARAVLDFDAATTRIGQMADEAQRWADHHQRNADFVGPVAQEAESAGPLPIRPDLHVSDYETNYAPLLHPSDRAAYAKTRMDDLRSRMDELERQSSRIAASLAQRSDLTPSDLLHLNRKLEATRAARASIDAQIDAIPMFDQIKNDAATGDAFRAVRDNEWAKLRAVAEGELNIPALRQELEAASRFEVPDYLDAMGTDRVAERLAEAEAALPVKIEELRKRNATTIANGLLDKSDAELEAMASRVDALHRQFAAQSNLEDATAGALVANLTNDQKAAADLSKYLLGIDDDMLKSGALRGTYTAAREVLGRDRDIPIQTVVSLAERDGTIRKLLGDRRSIYDRLRRNVTHAIESGSPFATTNTVRQVAGDMAKPVLREFGINTDAQIDRFWTLVHTQAMKQLGELNPSKAISHVVKDGKQVESPLAREMFAARDAGWFGGGIEPGRYKGLVESADRIASSIIDHYRMLGEDLGRAATDVYLPNRLTPLAEREAARKSSRGFNVQTPSTGGGSGLQQFEKNRSMQVYQWQTPDGRWHQLDDMDFAYLAQWREPDGSWNRAFDELDGATKENIARIAEEVDSFRQTHPGVDDAARRQYLGKNADPWYLNEVAYPRLKALTGGSPIAQELFDTNALYLLARRQSEQLAHQAQRSFRPILDRLALNTRTETTRLEDMGPLGKTVRFRGGATGVITRGADGRATVMVGDTLYRPLRIKPEQLNADGLMQNVVSARDLTRMYPEQFAEMVERAFEVSSKPTDMAAIARAMEKVTSVWKSVTLAHPSWVIFNLAGLVWNTAMGRIPIDGVLRHFKDAMRATLNRNNIAGIDREVVLNGQRRNLADIAVESHLSWEDSGRYGEALTQNKGTRENVYGKEYRPDPGSMGERLSGAAAGARQYPSSLRSEFKKRSEMYARQFAAERALTPAEKLKIAGQMFYDEAFVRRFLGPWFKMNGLMEETYRTAAYMALLDQGMSPLAASNHIRETFYDFADMTNAERSVRRYALPFFSWLRNNASYQMRTFLNNHKWAAMAPKLKEAIEEGIAGENQLPDHMRPSWMREQLAIQLGSDPESRTALTVGTVIPTEPVYNIPSALLGNDGVMNTMKWLAGGINPAVGVPLQVAAGREFFTGRSIGANPGEGDIPLSEFAASQIRPVREFVQVGARTPPGVRAFQKGAGQGALRLALGGRAQAFDAERVNQQLQRELDERANEMRKYIRVAESNGNHEESLRGRVRLLSLYQDAQKRGLKTPKWSQRQLGSMASS